MKKIFSLLAAVLFAGSMMAGQFVRVSDMANLAPGDQIILVSESEDYALGATQNTNNRAAVAVTVANDVIEAGENVQVITLEASGQNLKLKVGEDAYLYAASSSSNHLKTADAATAGDNAVWAISTSGDTVTLIAQGTNTRNILHFNPNNGNPIFSCYGATSSVTALVKIFKAEGGVTPIVGVETIYNWATAAADQVGTTILGTTGVEISTVKIHTNTDEVPGIKFGSSYVYADGKWIAIKPANGGFKAGDKLSVAAVFNNADDTKYAQVDVYAADGATRMFRSDSASTINGRTSAADPIVQTYTLASDQDSLFLGRYGNTGMFITLLKVERALVPPTPAVATPVISGDVEFTDSVIVTITCSTPDADIYYTTDGTTDPKCDCAAAPEYKKPIVIKATTTIMAAAYTGNDWSAVATKTFTKKEPLADPTNCAEAAAAALSVSANNELYNNGKVYTIEGYVTEIATAFSEQYKNITFWMADTKDGGKVLEAFRAVCDTVINAPIVGDKVKVTGSLTKYNTTPEFAAGCTFVITEHGTPVEPQNLGEKTIAEFLELKNKVDTCILTGVVLNIKKNDDGSYNKYGNFDLADATDTVYVYGLLTADGVAQKFPEMGVDEGDTLTIKAVYGEYNGNPQAPNAVFVSVKKASQGIEEVMAENEGKTMKFVQGGQIYILRDNKVYGIRGERIR